MNSITSIDENCNWVEIIEPKCKEKMYVNLSTGDCQWEQPENVTIKKMDKDQWWELYDSNTHRFYYYSAATRETIWHRPQNVDIVPLAKLQIMRQNTEVSDKRSTPLGPTVQRCSSSQGTPATWTPTSSNRSHSVTPNPSANTPPVRTTLPTRNPSKCPVEQRLLQGFEEQCTVSEASMDSGLPADNSSYDSLDGGPASHAVDLNKVPPACPPQSESGHCSGTISERPTALAMGISSLRGTPQSRRTAFPRTNPSYRRPTDAKPNILFSSQRCCKTPGNSGYANLGSPDTANSVAVVSDDPEALSPDTHTSQSSGSSTEVAETRSSSQAALSNIGVSQSVGAHPTISTTRESGPLRSSKASSVASNSTTTTEVCTQSGAVSVPVPNYPAVSSWMVTKCGDINSPQVEGGGSGYYEAYVPSIVDMIPPRPTAPINTHMIQSMAPLQQPVSSFHQGPLPGWSSNLFRKNIPPEKLLVWSRESLQKPMLKATDKALKKESCEAFKYIQIFMGDRKSKHLPKEACQLLIKTGQKYPMMRDEILVQLCKQTTNNPDEVSASRGWELMCACISNFMPSPVLLPYLEGYILRHLQNFPDERPQPALVQRFALIAAEILRQPALLQGSASSQGMTSPPMMRMDPSESSKLYPASMFGTTLEMMMALQHTLYPERKLPWILVSLCEEILRRKGREEEHIFNLYCDPNTLKALRISCSEFWDVSGHSYLEKYGKNSVKQVELLHNPHFPANLLKCWIEELATPLIPAHLISSCIHVARSPYDATLFVGSLPQLNRLCLIYLIRFLQLFTSEDVVNRTKIRLDNLAQIFSIPVFQNSLNYLLPEQIQPGSPDPMLELASFLRTLILHLNTVEIQDMN